MKNNAYDEYKRPPDIDIALKHGVNDIEIF